MSKPLGCGTCSMCCRFMEVDDLVPKKEAGTWCHHVIPRKGCGIYEHRPASCRKFKCLWLMADEEGVGPSLSTRPDKSKVMMSLDTTGETLVLRVDPAYPLASKVDWVQNLIQAYLAEGKRAVVETGTKVDFYGRKK